MAAEQLISTTLSGGMNWYAIYTKHNHERKSADLLSRKGIEIFLPMYKSVRRWKDRKKSLSMPLFPGYVFLRTSLQDKKIEILSTAGVFFIVESAGHACPVPEQEILAIRAIEQSGASFEPHPFLKSGEFVRIRSGSLSGITGIYLKPRNKHRVVVSIELLRKAVAVEVDAANLERVHDQGNKLSLDDSAGRGKTLLENAESPDFSRQTILKKSAGT